MKFHLTIVVFPLIIFYNCYFKYKQRHKISIYLPLNIIQDIKYIHTNEIINTEA